MKKTKLRGILTCLAIVPLLGCAIVEDDRVIENDSTIVSSVISNNHTVVDDLATSNDSIRACLEREVQKYVKANFPKAPSEVPGLIVKYGLENNIDICFMMAQTHIETGFGTQGIGRATSRRSIFGIYVTYSSYDKCVKHYVETLHKHYLTRNRTVHDLMKKYVTTGGARYAGDKTYEVKLSSVYKKICKSTNVLQLQSEYNANIEAQKNNEKPSISIKIPYSNVQSTNYPWYNSNVFYLWNSAPM